MDIGVDTLRSRLDLISWNAFRTWNGGQVTGSVITGGKPAFAGRHWDYDPLTKRNNGVALGQAKVDEQLDDLDELHHAARWWMRAARLVPGTPLAAKARLLALESMPKIARASSYGETRAREIAAGKASREIYDKLRSESPQSAETAEAAWWSIPDTTPLHQHDAWSSDMPVRYLWPYQCPDSSAALGYPFSDGRAFEIAVLPDAALRPDQDVTEVMRVLDSLQLTAKHQVSTPVNWKPGDDVIIPTSVTEEQARQKYPSGWKTLKPYLRVVAQPK